MTPKEGLPSPDIIVMRTGRRLRDDVQAMLDCYAQLIAEGFDPEAVIEAARDTCPEALAYVNSNHN